MASKRRCNRKKQAQGLGFPAPLALVLVVGALVALSYLWLCGRCEDLGERIKDLEARKAELQRQVVNEEFKWTNMKAPQNMERLLRTHQLDMEWPGEQQVHRLPMSAVRALGRHPAKHHPQYAQRADGTLRD